MFPLKRGPLIAVCVLVAFSGVKCVFSQSQSSTVDGSGSFRSVFSYVAKASQFTDDFTNRYQMPYWHKIIPLAFNNVLFQSCGLNVHLMFLVRVLKLT